jgi:hypothetical protein
VQLAHTIAIFTSAYCLAVAGRCRDTERCFGEVPSAALTRRV